MQRRTGAHELLDGPLDQALLAGNLDDLERINRRGAGLSWSLVRRLEPWPSTVRLLDIGTGGADIPRYLLRQAELAEIRLEITATDVRPEIVGEAQRRSAGIADLRVLSADGGGLEFGDGAFDVAHASMVLHHLEPAPATELLAEMGRVARRGVIVNELDRRRLWWLGARAIGLFGTRNPYTRHDAPLSVARSYLADEMSAMAAQAGLREIGRVWTRPAYRYALLLVRR